MGKLGREKRAAKPAADDRHVRLGEGRVACWDTGALMIKR